MIQHFKWIEVGAYNITYEHNGMFDGFNAVKGRGIFYNKFHHIDPIKITTMKLRMVKRSVKTNY